MTTLTILAGQSRNVTTLQIDPGAAADPSGVLYWDVLNNAGSLSIAAGDELAFGSIVGSGTIFIRTGGLLHAMGKVDVKQTLNFSPAGGQLSAQQPTMNGQLPRSIKNFSLASGSVIGLGLRGFSVPSVLNAPSVLQPGEFIWSQSGGHVLVMQPDGNLVLFNKSGYVPIWHTRTSGNSGAFLRMQSDGNLVVYSSIGRALWASGTWGMSATKATLQNDGNLVISTAANVAVWGSGTSGL